jgi:apolipoprotein N-acyltransferase
MDVFLQVFYTFFSSVLLSLAIPNELFYFGSPYLGIIALIPFYIAISRCHNFREAILLTMMQTVLVHLMSSFWLGCFKGYAFLTLGFSAIGTSLLSALFGGLYYLPWAWQSSRTSLMENAGTDIRRIPFRILWFPTIYVIWEWVKSNGFLGYPWGTVSSTIFRWHFLMQIADITGTYGITFLLIFFSSVCAEGILLTKQLIHAGNPLPAFNIYRKTAETWTLLFICAFAYGAFQYLQPRQPEKQLNAVLVQQNYDPWQSSDDTSTILRSEQFSEKKLTELRNRGEKADVVVWSEGVLNHSFPNGEIYYNSFPLEEPLIPFIQRMNTPFIIGGAYIADQQRHQYNNAALLFDNNGIFRGYYGKLHLVPFAEVIPGIEYPKVYDLVVQLFGFSGWHHGDQYVYFDLPCHYDKNRPKPAVKIISLTKTPEEQQADENMQPSVRVSTPICFDDSFPEVCRPFSINGNELFINITDDSWSKFKSAEYQHFIISSYRAIECRTTLVRSTNAGYSVVLDPAGRILADMPLFESTAMTVSIPIYRPYLTAYIRFGNWFPAVCTIIAACVCILYVLSGKKEADVPSERNWHKKKHGKTNKKKHQQLKK